MDSMRDDLNSAMEHLDSEGAETPIEAIEPVEPQESQELSKTPDSDEKASVDPTFSPDSDEKEPEIEQKEPETLKSESVDTGGTETKAPSGWTPKLRESWSKVPAEVQAHINAREKDMQEVMKDTAGARQVHQRMSTMATKYGSLMASEGVSDPIQAAEGMFDTVARLRMGTPQQKAQTLAGMIKHYGVDIATLDSALVGEASAAAAPNAQLEQMVEQRMAPVNELMRQLQAQQEQKGEQTKVQAQEQIQKFAETAEFLGDVRNDMADLIDMAAARGQDMSIQEAYNKAIAINPEILRVLEQRNIAQGNAKIETKRNAAASITGRKTGTGNLGGAMSLREQISSAWDDNLRG